MTRIDPRQLDRAFAPVDAPMFSDLIAQVEADWTLPPTRRRDLASGLRRVAKALDRPPSDVPADPAWLQRRLSKISPVAIGLTPKSWSNALSDARAAMALFGIVRRRFRRTSDLGPEWRRLWTLVRASGDPSIPPALCRFVHFLDRLGVAPDAVREDHVLAYREAIEREEISRSPETASRAAANGWNLAVDRLPEWPRRKLALPSRVSRVALPLETFSRSFRDDLDRHLRALANPDPLDPDASLAALRPSSVKQRRREALRFASALVHAGMPAEEIVSLAVLVEPANAERGLRWMLARNGGRTSVGISSTAMMLRGVARRHVRAPETQQAAIDRLARRLATPQRKGMTAKNRDRLQALQDPAALRRLLSLPERILAGAAGRRTAGYRWVDREDAVAMAILLVCPVRVSNLAGIHLERNIRRPGDGRAFLVFEAEDVKNSRRIEFELPAGILATIDRHLAARPAELCPPGTPWLFPRRDGAGPVGSSALGARLTRTIRRELGLEMNPHLFRHLAAMIWLEANPGAYEAARRLLGHSELSTTLNAYAGFEAGTATRLFAELIDKARKA